MSEARVAIVTGAAQGIGAGIARLLAAEGWRLALVDIDEAALAATARQLPEDRTHAIHCDVSDPVAAGAAVVEARDRFARLDGLVSNAGIMRTAPIAETDAAEWDRVLATNLSACFHLARAAAPSLRATRGAIVAIASTRAHMSEPDTEAYAASKGGLVALSHALAISLGPEVRVNCVSPGWIETGDRSALSEADHAQHPAGRVGTVDDVAAAVAYLLDGTRAGFVTGSELVVDGGMTRKMIYAD